MSWLPENPNKDLVFKDEDLKEIYLAGGCYWGVDAFMARVYGVAYTEVGFANGYDDEERPTYEEVCKNDTGHAEVVHLKYDNTKTDLEKILTEFFSIINPTSLNKQGEDEGSQYRTGIYYTHKNDDNIILEFIDKEQDKYTEAILVEVLPLRNYTPAEEGHQDYLEKNPEGYCHIKF